MSSALDLDRPHADLSYADGRDYVYSSWTDTELHSWLANKGLVKSTPVKKRDELLDLIRKPYADATSNVYESWSDSHMVSSRADRPT